MDLPYCRICGTKIEENAHFCHRCGTPVAAFMPAPQAKPMEKNSFLVPVIILIIVVVVAVIVGVVAFWTFYSSFNHANGANQGNFSQLSFIFHDEAAKINATTQNLMGKTIFNNFAKGLQNSNPQSLKHKKLSVNILNTHSSTLVYKK